MRYCSCDSVQCDPSIVPITVLKGGGIDSINSILSIFVILELEGPFSSPSEGLYHFTHKKFSSFHVFLIRTHRHASLFKDIAAFAQNRKLPSE